MSVTGLGVPAPKQDRMRIVGSCVLRFGSPADAAGPALMIANEQDSKNSESACVPDQCTMIWPQQRLYFLPDPQGHGSLRPTFSVGRG